MRAMLVDIVEVLQHRRRDAGALLVSNLDSAYLAFWGVPLDVQGALGMDLNTFLERWPTHFVLRDVGGQPAVQLRRLAAPL